VAAAAESQKSDSYSAQERAKKEESDLAFVPSWLAIVFRIFSQSETF